MKHPFYPLRKNKAVDRLAFIDAIKRLGGLYALSEYIYCGMGGPYLEDFRLIYEFFPQLNMVSIERDSHTLKRQKFHLPCSKDKLQLKQETVDGYITKYLSEQKRYIFWLDYIGLQNSHFDEFMALLSKVPDGSMVKITLEAEPGNYHEEQNKVKFYKEFSSLLPDPDVALPNDSEKFAILLQDMIRLSSQKILSASMPNYFQPVSSFFYADGDGMFTLTGVVCKRSEIKKIRDVFENWELANLNWDVPKEINVPSLSTKERLRLQKFLPCDKSAEKTLYKELGYLIDEDEETTFLKLKQYALFHRYYPYFMKAIP